MKHIKSIIVSSIITLFSLSFISCGKMDTSDSHAAGEDNTSPEMCTGDSHAAGEDNRGASAMVSTRPYSPKYEIESKLVMTSPEMDSLELILKKCIHRQRISFLTQQRLISMIKTQQKN